ncbi:MAG: PAS domain S-box protein [Promethearchaeota archaeon]|jgi:PAS domain S-box-containing protein
MRALADSTPNLIIIADPDGKIQFVNRTISNVDNKDVIGRNIYEYIQPEYHDEVRRIIRKVFQTGQFGRYEVGAVDSSGKISWFETNVGPIKQDDRIISVSLISTEISERKNVEDALKESEKRFRTIAEQSFMGVSIIQDGVIKYSNQKLADIHGRSIEQLLKWKPKDFLATIHPDEIGSVLEEMNALINGDKETSQFEIKSINDDGEIIWLNQFSGRIEYQGKPALLTNIIDITERKEYEKKIKDSELKYREAFNRAEFYKDLFSHDMNNILQNILSANELIKFYHGNPNKSQEILDLSDMVKEQVNRGSKLINNIRKLSQLEVHKVKLQNIEITKLVEKISKFIKNQNRERTVEISIDSLSDNVYIQTDELIEDVLENLLLNAVKHNKSPKVQITIKISKTVENGINYHKLEFIDNGQGVEDPQKEHIFQRVQTDGKASVSGMGLGLSIVKKIVESYNGKIWVEDRIKGATIEGSKFTILIPEAS